MDKKISTEELKQLREVGKPIACIDVLLAVKEWVESDEFYAVDSHGERLTGITFKSVPHSLLKRLQKK